MRLFGFASPFSYESSGVILCIPCFYEVAGFSREQHFGNQSYGGPVDLTVTNGQNQVRSGLSRKPSDQFAGELVRLCAVARCGETDPVHY